MGDLLQTLRPRALSPGAGHGGWARCREDLLYSSKGDCCMIRKIVLRNFKSFRSASIEFDAITLLYGANATGKSNLVDALRLLRNLGQGKSVRDAVEGHSSSFQSGQLGAVEGIRGGAASMPNLSLNSGISSFELYLKTPKHGAIYWDIAINVHSYQIVAERLSAFRHPGEYVYATEWPPPIEQPAGEDEPGIRARVHTGRRGPNPNRAFSTHETILSQFSGRKAETAYNEQYATALLDELGSISPLELRPEVLRQYSPLGRFELGEHGENFAAVVWLMEAAVRNQQRRSERQEQGRQTAPEIRLDAVRSWISQLTPRPISEISTDQAPTGEVIFAVKEQPFDTTLTARVLSDGTLRFAALAVALFHLSDPHVYVIEELENGLNPSRLFLLAEMTEAALRSNKTLQVIATTHSAQLLDYLDEDWRSRVRIFGSDSKNGDTTVLKLKDLPGYSEASAESPLSELLEEGWLQFAASRA